MNGVGGEHRLLWTAGVEVKRHLAIFCRTANFKMAS